MSYYNTETCFTRDTKHLRNIIIIYATSTKEVITLNLLQLKGQFEFFFLSKP